MRVPFAGGTLFSLSDTKSWGSTSLTELQNIQDSSLLLLADILPTGVFAALQALGHPKILPMITGTPYPYCLIPSGGVGVGSDTFVQVDDKMLTFAIIGLGPVGVVSAECLSDCKDFDHLLQCTAVSLLDMLAARQLPFKIIAIDPIKARREKMNAVYAKIDISGRGYGKFVTKSIEEAGDTVREWTNGVGCTSVLEVMFTLFILRLMPHYAYNIGSRQQQRPYVGIRLGPRFRNNCIRRGTPGAACSVYRSCPL